MLYSLIFLVIAIILGWEYIKESWASRKREATKLRTALTIARDGGHVLYIHDYLEENSAVLAKNRMVNDIKSTKVRYKYAPELKIIRMDRKKIRLSVFTRMKISALRFVLNMIVRRSHYDYGGSLKYVKRDNHARQRDVYWDVKQYNVV